MTFGLEGWFNGMFNIYKRVLSLIGSVMLLMPPLEIIYGINGVYYNIIGILILIVMYFLQGKLNFKMKTI